VRKYLEQSQKSTLFILGRIRDSFVEGGRENGKKMWGKVIGLKTLC